MSVKTKHCPWCNKHVNKRLFSWHMRKHMTKYGMKVLR